MSTTQQTSSSPATDYQSFIKSKRIAARPAGFEGSKDQLNPSLFPWQADCVQWALRKGRVLFCWRPGLGKTISQLVFAEQVYKHTGRPVLILAPILVSWQTAEEAEKFNINAPVRVCSDQQDAIACGGICVTNYEKLHKFDLSYFVGVVLDESSILKNYMGKRKQQLQEAFRETQYKLCCTATPAPNDLLELLNQADFLGIMPSREAIARWFINDTMHAGRYRLKGHAEADFWRWVSSWAVCLSSPADLGFSDEGFVLPELRVHEHIIRGSSWFTAEEAEGISATGVHGEKRKTLEDRCGVVADLVRDSEDQWAIWCGTDYEADELLRQITGSHKQGKIVEGNEESGDVGRRKVIEIRGSSSEAWKEIALRGFKSGQFQSIISKARLSGYGINWQHCHKMTWFASYSWEDYFQALCRLHRFMQVNPVDVHIVASENELSILDTITRKQKQYELTNASVAVAARDYQQAEIYGRTIAEYVPVQQVALPTWLKGKAG